VFRLRATQLRNYEPRVGYKTKAGERAQVIDFSGALTLGLRGQRAVRVQPSPVPLQFPFPLSFRLKLSDSDDLSGRRRRCSSLSLSLSLCGQLLLLGAAHSHVSTLERRQLEALPPAEPSGLHLAGAIAHRRPRLIDVGPLAASAADGAAAAAAARRAAELSISAEPPVPRAARAPRRASKLARLPSVGLSGRAGGRDARASGRRLKGSRALVSEPSHRFARRLRDL